jgi:HEAT repeat protein
VVADDLDEGVRETAALALGKTWSEEAVEPLIGALRDADSGVRGAAADALAATWSERAIDALRGAAADDPSAQVRERALSALTRLGADEAPAALRQAMQDPSPRIRRMATELLSLLRERAHQSSGGRRSNFSMR